MFFNKIIIHNVYLATDDQDKNIAYGIQEESRKY